MNDNNFTGFIFEEDDEKKYMMTLITYSISPTISGYKPASIINISNKYKSMYDLWCKYGEEYMSGINLKAFKIFSTDSSLILLFYNEVFLSRVLFCKDNMDFLNKFGYSSDMSLLDSLNLLKERYRSSCCPHEMGIFLGIPLPDVKDFMYGNDKKCVCCGYWKVYNDREQALYTFENYNRSKHNFIKLIRKKMEIVKVVKMLSSAAAEI